LYEEFKEFEALEQQFAVEEPGVLREIVEKAMDGDGMNVTPSSDANA
jgi:hypothetical protein